MKYDTGVIQWQGRRAYQQDAVHVERRGEDVILAIMADGMGGAPGGDVASKIAVEQVVKNINPEHKALGDHYIDLANQANNAIAQHVQENERLKGMGTTLVILLIDEHRMQWLSVGDSPLWICRGGRLMRKNLDESYGGYLDHLVSEGRMDPDKAKSDPRRNHLMNILNGASTPVQDIDSSCALAAGDIVILSSDGLQTLDDRRIAEVIGENPGESAEELAQCLMRAVAGVEKAQQDNVTTVVIKVLDETEFIE